MRIRRKPRPEVRRKGPFFAFDVPHCRQSLPITCGPSCLLMAMKALDGRTKTDRSEELDLWRETTTIVWPTGRGHGGCPPQSLALAASRRGFAAEVHMDWAGGGSHPFNGLHRRNRERVEVVRLLWDRDMARAHAHGVQCFRDWPGVHGIEARFAAGWLPVLLVNCKYLHGEIDSHYVVVTGFDEQAFYINDPWIPVGNLKTAADMTNRRVPREAFGRIARFGGNRWRAVVFLRRSARAARTART